MTITLTAAETTTLERLVVDYIAQGYATARERLGAREPVITVGEVAHYVWQHSECPEPIRDLPRAIRNKTRLALDRLVRRGVLEASHGYIGPRYPSVRCFAPKATPIWHCLHGRRREENCNHCGRSANDSIMGTTN